MKYWGLEWLAFLCPVLFWFFSVDPWYESSASFAVLFKLYLWNSSFLAVDTGLSVLYSPFIALPIGSFSYRISFALAVLFGASNLYAFRALRSLLQLQYSELLETVRWSVWFSLFFCSSFCLLLWSLSSFEQKVLYAWFLLFCCVALERGLYVIGEKVLERQVGSLLQVSFCVGAIFSFVPFVGLCFLLGLSWLIHFSFGNQSFRFVLVGAVIFLLGLSPRLLEPVLASAFLGKENVRTPLLQMPLPKSKHKKKIISKRKPLLRSRPASIPSEQRSFPIVQENEAKGEFDFPLPDPTQQNAATLPDSEMNSFQEPYEPSSKKQQSGKSSTSSPSKKKLPITFPSIPLSPKPRLLNKPKPSTHPSKAFAPTSSRSKEMTEKQTSQSDPFAHAKKGERVWEGIQVRRVKKLPLWILLVLVCLSIISFVSFFYFGFHRPWLRLVLVGISFLLIGGVFWSSSYYEEVSGAKKRRAKKKQVRRSLLVWVESLETDLPRDTLVVTSSRRLFSLFSFRKILEKRRVDISILPLFRVRDELLKNQSLLMNYQKDRKRFWSSLRKIALSRSVCLEESLEIPKEFVRELSPLGAFLYWEPGSSVERDSFGSAVDDIVVLEQRKRYWHKVYRSLGAILYSSELYNWLRDIHLSHAKFYERSGRWYTALEELRHIEALQGQKEGTELFRKHLRKKIKSLRP